MSMHDTIALVRISWRLWKACPPRLIGKFLYNFGWRNFRNMARFEKRQAAGAPFFPAFVMISVTESCNLACSGCWVSAGGKKRLSLRQLEGIVTNCKKQGSYFFGILGGEPLMYKGLLEVMEKHPDCYFQLFTNATLLTEEVAFRLKKMGNVTPLISIEGWKEESDSRRGKEDVLERTLKGVRACRKAGLIFGVAASLCRSNYEELASRAHIERMAQEGAFYLWYYIYRPVGAVPNVENALTKEQIRRFRQFIVEQRKDAPLFIVDTYWDDEGRAVCPAATGLSHHIAPSGALEFCPPLQMAKDFLDEDASNLAELFGKSGFLAEFRKLAAETSRGCILLEDPRKMLRFLEEQKATDTTTRGTVQEEYARMRPVPGHDMKEERIPERNVFYKFLKKRYFFGFGAYG